MSLLAAAAGITPAWAGKSNKKWLRRTREEGLPPRGRGRETIHVRLRRDRGITPAWAGKRVVLIMRRHRHGDYPRVGGEEQVVALPEGVVPGLPPRGRGRGSQTEAHQLQQRITPAWAGKSLIYNQWFRDEKDYPRVGGEE